MARTTVFEAVEQFILVLGGLLETELVTGETQDGEGCV